MARTIRNPYGMPTTDMTIDEFQSQFFDVEERPLYVGTGGINYSSGLPNVQLDPSNKYLVRKDNGMLLSPVSNQYKVIDTKQVYNETEHLLNEAGVKFSPIRVDNKDGGKSQFVRIKLDDYRILIDDDNVLDMYFILINNFTRITAYQLVLETLRLICTNGATAIRPAFDLSIKHRGDTNRRITDGLNMYIEGGITDTRNHIERLGNTTPDTDKVLFYLENNPILKGENWSNELFDMWSRESDKSLWGLYNTFTYLITHRYGRNIDSKLTKRNVLNQESNKWLRTLTPSASAIAFARNNISDATYYDILEVA